MSIDKIKAKLNEVVDQAQVRLDLETAANPALQRAIHIVESFLRRTGRVCYGGQAINAQLPQRDQFYNPETSLPDYDFFSPGANADAEDLIGDFKAAGYTEISKRIGIHEGTMKLYVNFTAIADITQMVPDFYETIYRKSVSVNGIHYTDPVFLRMLMYLELSRPRGQVERWGKVYERLMLLDKAHPLRRCRQTPSVRRSHAAGRVRPDIVRFMIAKRRVFMGADIEALYRPSGVRSAASRVKFLLHGSAPVVFLSPDAEMDAGQLASMAHARKESIKGFQNILPAMTALYVGDDLVCLIVQEEACHSIVSFPLTKQRYLRAASLETLLTFLIGLYYRNDIALFSSQESLLCWFKAYIDLSNRYKARPTKLIPAFSIECSGYQTTFASLLRAKGARIEAERQKISSGRRYNKTQGRPRFVDHGSRKTRRRYL